MIANLTSDEGMSFFSSTARASRSGSAPGDEIAMSRDLTSKGYGVLAINTRQSDERVNTDNFVEVRRDIEAAVYVARALGYRTLVLYGHSLGSIQVQYYAANNWEPDIKAVVMSGTFGNLPWKSRTMVLNFIAERVLGLPKSY